MKRILAPAVLAIGGLFFAVTTSWAAGPDDIYPELRDDGRVYIVGRWADGRYTTVVREYPEQRFDGTMTYVYEWNTGGFSILLREYIEQRFDGNWWTVRQWDDGTFSSVRIPSPPPPAAEPAPAPAPATPSYSFAGSIGGLIGNCGITEIQGRIRDPNGNLLNGYRVKVSWPTGSATSETSGKSGQWDTGFYDLVLDSESKDGLWRVWMVDDSGNQISDQINVRTTRECGSESSPNTVIVNWRRSA